MRRIAVLSLVPLLLVASACSRNAVVESEPSTSTSASSAVAFPLGTYDFSATVDGETRTGSFVIQGAPGAYTGYVTLDGESDSATMSDVRVDGSRLIFDADAPGESFTFDVTFTGSSFSGSVIAPVGSIPVSGSRRAT